MCQIQAENLVVIIQAVCPKEQVSKGSRLAEKALCTKCCRRTYKILIFWPVWSSSWFQERHPWGHCELCLGGGTLETQYPAWCLFWQNNADGGDSGLHAVTALMTTCTCCSIQSRYKMHYLPSGRFLSEHRTPLSQGRPLTCRDAAVLSFPLNLVPCLSALHVTLCKKFP